VIDRPALGGGTEPVEFDATTPAQPVSPRSREENTTIVRSAVPRLPTFRGPIRTTPQESISHPPPVILGVSSVILGVTSVILGVRGWGNNWTGGQIMGLCACWPSPIPVASTALWRGLVCLPKGRAHRTQAGRSAAAGNVDYRCFPLATQASGIFCTVVLINSTLKLSGFGAQPGARIVTW
jgi:hypothetical protein